MIARTSWSAKKEARSGESARDRPDADPPVTLDDLLDARFDEEGKLSGAGSRATDRLDPRPPAMSAEELERAVQKLARGLEAIERQGAAPRRVEPSAPQPRAGEPRGRDFVTYSLDRLEARLEALSKRLEQRAAAAGQAEAPSAGRAADFISPEPHSGARRAEPSAEEASRQAEAARAARQAEQAEAKRRQDAAEAARRAETAAAEARRQAEQAETRRLEEAEAKRREAEEAARRAEAAAAAEARRNAEQAELRRQAEQAEAKRREAEEAARHAAAATEAEARRQAEAAGEMKRQFVVLEERIETLQREFGENQVEPLRQELLEVLRQVDDVNRDGRSVAGAVEHIRGRLDEMEAKLNAARNMTGNRLSELQDRLSGLAERLGDMESEIPGFDAVRENQGAILERFDRIEGMVARVASPDDLSDRVENLRRQLDEAASHGDVARIGEQILTLADRLDALPSELTDPATLGRIEGQLQTLAQEFSEARQQRKTGAAEIDARLTELSSSLKAVSETDRTPNFSGLEQRLTDIRTHLDEGRRASGDALARLDKRLFALSEAVEKQEHNASAEALAALTVKMEVLAEAIGAQDVRGARRDLEGLDRKLDQLHRSLATQADLLSASQMESLGQRLDRMQAQLEELSKGAQFGPFAQRLQDISDRLNGFAVPDNTGPLAERLSAIEERLAGLARSPDTRALHTQLESIVSRLELLKGRSIDPARLNELFDRVDAALRGNLNEERFDRLERKFAETPRGIADDRFARLEQKLDAGMRSALPDERLARLEQKLDEIGRARGIDSEVLTPDDLADLRTDIIALRRELRSLPGLGEGEANLGEVLKTVSDRLERLPYDPPATAVELESQIERIAHLLEDPTHSRLALAHIETSLRTIEERLDETRRAALYRGGRDDEGAPSADVESVASLARAISDDVTVLKGSAEASEKKTKDALEAVQSTLEAVVKRMAFLERDADAAAAPPAAAPPPAEPAPRARALPEVTFPERVPHEINLSAPLTAPEPPPLVAAAADEPAAKPEQPREGGSGGLFSRFTSSQLLKRATGGRAESFSPDGEEADETSDLPLEPGTDSPLTSALTGAPSSDTALMSGARSRGKGASPLARDADAESLRSRIAPEPIAGNDFLAAARRAAQAASAEVAEAERDAEGGTGTGVSRIVGLLKGRRRAILASALAVAVAFAAYQVLRNQLGVGDPEVAALPPSSGPALIAEAPEPAGPSADAESAREMELANATPEAAPAEDTPLAELPQPIEPPPTAASADPADLRPEDPAEVSSADAAATVAPAQSIEAAEPAPSMAAVQPAPQAAGATPSTSASLPTGLPAPVGPERLREVALTGDPAAAFEVAARYAEGRGVVQDLTAAVGWYTHAADAGLAPAQYRLGSIYEKGLGVPKDLAVAQRWYRRAADAGNVKAMHNLAVLYAEGAGGEPNLEQAAELFRKAAEHGVRDSQFNLAILHARGLGVPQDMVVAFKWFAVAAGSGDAEALKRRDIIGAALSKPDLEKAQAEAAAFQPLPILAEANEVSVPEGGWGQDLSAQHIQSTNDLVALVQMLLAEKGFDPGPADGLLGRQTIQAINAFQEQAGMPTTGQIDTGLVAALQEQQT